MVLFRTSMSTSTLFRFPVSPGAAMCLVDKLRIQPGNSVNIVPPENCLLNFPHPCRSPPPAALKFLATGLKEGNYKNIQTLKQRIYKKIYTARGFTL